MVKTKPMRHLDICKELNDLYTKKNHDYGDSFGKTFQEEGFAMTRIRLADKFERFKTLSRGNDILVADESIRDTLMDLANYAIMTVLEMDDASPKKDLDRAELHMDDPATGEHTVFIPEKGLAITSKTLTTEDGEPKDVYKVEKSYGDVCFVDFLKDYVTCKLHQRWDNPAELDISPAVLSIDHVSSFTVTAKSLSAAKARELEKLIYDLLIQASVIWELVAERSDRMLKALEFREFPLNTTITSEIRGIDYDCNNDIYWNHYIACPSKSIIARIREAVMKARRERQKNHPANDISVDEIWYQSADGVYWFKVNDEPWFHDVIDDAGEMDILNLLIELVTGVLKEISEEEPKC